MSLSRRLPLLALPVLTALLLLAGCGGDDADSNAGGDVPQFSLAWSEYPSWSVFGVADMYGLIDKEAGKMGPIEKKHNVDIVLRETDYVPGLTLYAAGEVDAVCITNMDILAPSASRPGVAILPTSTSNGADALIVTGIDSIEQLKGVSAYGAEETVSQYTFVRGLQENGFDPAEFTFKNMDPGAAAQAMITKQEGYNAIVVWNPFVLETRKQRPDAKVLFDSSAIPNEIIDMVVMAETSLNKEGGDRAARAIAETFYEVCKKMESDSEGDQTLKALGEKFSSLDVEAMRTVVKQTDFYETPQLGAELFESEELKQTMGKVAGFCREYGIISGEPTIGYSRQGDQQLKFTAEYLKPAGQ